jgi:hypothetical protein
LPLSFQFEAPYYWHEPPPGEPDSESTLEGDTCIIDGEFFFILGNIPLPIIGSNHSFYWTVWLSLSQQNFDRALELWDRPERSSEPPYFGWLSSQIPGYPDTLNLKTMVHTQPVGERPLIELEPTDHPLALEQRDGITWQRVREIAETVLHGGTEGDT